MSLTDRSTNYASRPVSYRLLILRNLLRLNAGATHRPHYGWCVYHAATQAKAVAPKAVTVIELGVAGGNGLHCLCDNSRQIARKVAIEIRVVGFDSGSGLPASTGRRDILYAWPAGSFQIDRAALERRMGNQTQFVFGNILETVGAWQPNPQTPLAAVLFDLDYFTSTVNALPVLTKANALPRVWCYFDDICSGPEEAATEGVGEREAIRIFNLSPEREALNDRVSKAYSFKGHMPEPWHQQIYESA
jgi:hypothetical protein